MSRVSERERERDSEERKSNGTKVNSEMIKYTFTSTLGS